MGISFQHIIILAIILIILGPKRLPELAHMLGKAYRNFKDVLDGVNEARFKKIADEIIEPKSTPERPKNTVHTSVETEETPLEPTENETDKESKSEKKS